MSVASSSSSSSSSDADTNERYQELQETHKVLVVRGAAEGMHHLAHASTMTLEGALSKQSNWPLVNIEEGHLETFHTTETEEGDSPSAPATPEKEDFWKSDDAQALKLDGNSKLGLESLLEGQARRESCWNRLFKDAGRTEHALKSVLDANMMDKIVKPLQQQVQATMQKMQNDIVQALHDNNIRRNVMAVKCEGVQKISQDSHDSVWNGTTSPTVDGLGEESKGNEAPSSDGSTLVLGSNAFWQDLMKQRHPPDSLERIDQFLKTLDEYRCAFNTFDDSIHHITANFNGTTESFLEKSYDIYHPVGAHLDETQSVLQEFLVKNYKHRTKGISGAVKKQENAAEERAAYSKKRKWEK